MITAVLKYIFKHSLCIYNTICKWLVGGQSLIFSSFESDFCPVWWLALWTFLPMFLLEPVMGRTSRNSNCIKKLFFSLSFKHFKILSSVLKRIAFFINRNKKVLLKYIMLILIYTHLLRCITSLIGAHNKWDEGHGIINVITPNVIPLKYTEIPDALKLPAPNID